MRFRIVLFAALAIAAVSGCRKARPLASGQLHGSNVLLVTIDTLRRDRLGAYGSSAGLTPNLDRLAGDGVKYMRAFTHVPMTLPAHASILTGLTPRHHGVRNNVSFRLAEDVPTLATVLKSAGYRTGAFIGAFVLERRFGLSRGFDQYDDRFPPAAGSPTFRFAERRAADVVEPARKWILSPGLPAPPAPWFAWVHLFDPHAPYEAPAEYRAGRSPYDAEVAYTDAMLGKFLDQLRAVHALDRTLIVVVADHGESLGEHGETTHGLFAYDATLSVPLVVRGPGISPARVDIPVGHVDILPTVLDLLGLAIPAGLDGVSLAQPNAADRPLYFEALDANLTRGWAPLTGLVRSNWKYIDLPVPELYDLRSDPQELTNLFEHDRPRSDRMTRELRQILASPERRSGEPAPIDQDASARLRSLGYASGQVDPRRKTKYFEADDPKRLVSLNERFNTALATLNERRADEALAGFLSILRERPDFITARTAAATVLLSMGRPGDAVELLRDAPPDEASSPDFLAKLGVALREAGDLSGAVVALEEARRAGDQSAELLNDLGVAYARLGRADAARSMFRELLRIDPASATTWNNLGVFELNAHRPEAAADAFRHAVAVDPQFGDAWQGLGAALVDRDRPAAIDAWRQAERLKPQDYDLLFNLGMVLAASDRPSEAVPYLERFVREAPPDRYGADIRRVRATLERIQKANR